MCSDFCTVISLETGVKNGSIVLANRLMLTNPLIGGEQTVVMFLVLHIFYICEIYTNSEA